MTKGADDLFELLVPTAKKNIRKARKSLASNADPERNAAAGRLAETAREGKVARLQRMLGHGLHPDSVQDADSWTPLMTAAGWGELRSVRMLLDAGANANWRDDSNQSPLAVTVESPDIDPRIQGDLVQMLIDAGASLDALDSDARQKVVQVLQSPRRRASSLNGMLPAYAAFSQPERKEHPGLRPGSPRSGQGNDSPGIHSGDTTRRHASSARGVLPA